MWVYRCFNGDLFQQGVHLARRLEKTHPGGEVTVVYNALEGTAAVRVGSSDFGSVFTNLPSAVYPLVLFYNSQPPQRSARVVSVRQLTPLSQSVSHSSSHELPEAEGVSSSISLLVHHLTESFRSSCLP